MMSLEISRNEHCKMAARIYNWLGSCHLVTGLSGVFGGAMGFEKGWLGVCLEILSARYTHGALGPLIEIWGMYLMYLK